MPEKTKSLRGQLLLDGGNLAGSWFHRSVVLICQHNEEGAFGLVLNRPSGAIVGDAVVTDLPDTLKQLPLQIGGPVQPGALSYLLGDAFLPSASVMPNVELGHSLDQLIELAGEFSPTRKILVFAGYAGWSPGQLDDEIRRDAWLIQPATPEIIFDAEPAGLWRRILRDLGGRFRLLSDSPDDLASN
ncbi:MAG: YqgE/AlgH family protein [Verrucomicrobiales bacterium]|nr:YqgE/AlgH family protein [Verrucomicrobiales bacterium]